MRAPAQRSSQAARAIKTLIDDSAAGIRDGIRVVGSAAGTTQTLVGQAGRVSDLPATVASGIAEQADGTTGPPRPCRNSTAPRSRTRRWWKSRPPRPLRWTSRRTRWPRARRRGRHAAPAHLPEDPDA